jgi:hypothetical protein
MDAKWFGGAVTFLGGLFTAWRAAMKSHSYRTGRILITLAALGASALLYGLLNPTDITALYAPVGSSWGTIRAIAAGVCFVAAAIMGWEVVMRRERHRDFNMTWPAKNPSDPIPDRDPPKAFRWKLW